MNSIIKWIQDNFENRPKTAIVILLLMGISTLTSALIAANKQTSSQNKEHLIECYERMKVCEQRYEKLERKTDSIVNILFETIKGQQSILRALNEVKK